MGKETTKRVIAYAFKELLLEKPINKITINDIAQKCDINRQTFYYHFHDIVELTEWVCETEGENALKKNTTYSTWQEGFIGIFEILRQDKAFVTNIYYHTPTEYLNKYLYKVTYQLIYDVVEEKAGSAAVREEDKKFIANFYKYGFVGLVTEWIGSGMKEDPREIVGRLNDLIEGSIDHALQRAGAKKQ